MTVNDEKSGKVPEAIAMEVRMTSDGQLTAKIPTAKTEQGDKLPQCFAALIVTFAHFTSGYAMGWTSPALGMLAAEGTLLTATQIGWVGSIFCIGAALTTLLTGWLADRLGRKKTIILTAIPFIISWLLKATSAHSIISLYIARFCAGSSAGALVVIPPMYVAETVEPTVRGALSNLLLVMFNLGLVTAYIAGAILDSTMVLSLLGLIPVIMFLAGACTWLPESPVLLVSKGRRDEARAALRRLRGPRYDVDTELQQLEAVAAADREAAEDVSLLRLVKKSRGLRRGLGTTLGLMTCQQLCGISAILAYTASIFRAAGSTIDPNTCAVVMGALQVVFTLLCSGLLDRAGRRPLIIGSSFLMVLALCGLGGYFEARDAGVDLSTLTWIPLVAVCLYIVIYSGGLGPVPWVLVGEVFPARARGACAALVGMWAWGQAFFVTLAFPPLLEAIGIGGSVWLFAAGCGIAGLFSIAFCPETKGKSIEQILKELEGIQTSKFIS